MSPVANQSEVFFVGGGRSASSRMSPDIVGSKANNLAQLDRLGLRVPPAVVLGTAFCEEYFERGGKLDADFTQQLRGYLGQLEEVTGLRLGGRHPLLVSVRSSPPVSMPGMLDTILNVGFTETTVRALVRRTGNARLAWDAYRRFVRTYGETVLGRPSDGFDRLTTHYLAEANLRDVRDLDPLAIRSLARDSVDVLRGLDGAALPADPFTQLVQAVEAVWRSWMSPRAREYRRLNGVDATGGTGVLIQMMVFGNAGGSSGSGVGFTRNPTNGDNRPYVDFLFNAQGEDVVSGRQASTDSARLPHILPAVHSELERATSRLESEFRDMQDFEFTVEDGCLYFLQTRPGKRTPWAALRIAIDMTVAGIIDRGTALERLAAYDLDAIQRTRLQPNGNEAPIGTGVPAGLGVAIGAIALDSAKAQQMSRDGSVILVRSDISPDDIAGLASAAGVVTTRGGRTSHAAVVARQMGKACVVGCGALQIDIERRCCSFGDHTLREGAPLTIDSDSGCIYAGHVPVLIEKPLEALATIRTWRP